MKIAILGARGIGRVHAGVFFRLGQSISYVLGSTADSAALAAAEISQITGTAPESFSDLSTLLTRSPDAVVIATPPRVHFEEIMLVAGRGIPIFCEKPLFWRDGQSPESLMSTLEQIRDAAAHLLFLNSPNGYFLDSLAEYIGPPDAVREVRFAFYTQGKYRNSEIGIDLLTHGFTILYHLLGPRNLRHVKKSVEESRFRCHFAYGDAAVEFDFIANPDGDKFFELEVDGVAFRRVQRGSGADYRMSMLNTSNNREIAIEDPFVISARRFLELVAVGASGFQQEFDKTAAVYSLMVRTLSA